MKMNRRRFIAFLIDIFLVLLLASITSNSYTFNPYIYDYEDTYDEYSEVYDDIYGDFSMESVTDENLDKLSNVMYKLEKVNIYYYLYYLIFVLIYFVIFQWMNKGQTLGKKFMKLRVVNKDSKNPNIIQYIVRYLFNGSVLIMGFHLTLLIKTIILFIGISPNFYMNLYTLLSLVGFILEAVLIISFIRGKDNKLLNDFIAKTKVIEQ